MSAVVSASSSTPWRKRSGDNSDSEVILASEAKRSRYYYIKLASESSTASDDDTETICSIQGKETDYVIDTPDTDTKTESEYDYEIEYEVASSAESEQYSTSSSTGAEEDVLLAVTAAAIANNLEEWITDVEESDNSLDDIPLDRTEVSTCTHCNDKDSDLVFAYGEKCNKCNQRCRQCKWRKTYKSLPLCNSCYKNRTKFFPPRPKKTKKQTGHAKQLPQQQPPVKLNTLRLCLSGLSQDSGLGSSVSSQECPSLDLHKIVVPSDSFGPVTGTSNDVSDDVPASETSDWIDDKSSSKEVKGGVCKRRSDTIIENNEVNPKRIKIENDNVSEKESDGALEPSCSGNSANLDNFKFDRTKRDVTSEMCIFCNNAPKDTAFMHTNFGHMCCCYRCAKKTFTQRKKCPICNRPVHKIAKIFMC